MNIWKKIVSFFAKLEGHLRGWLSRHPILYGLIGGVGIVLFWRGIWVTADVFMPYVFSPSGISYAVTNPGVLWDGPVTLLVSTVLLLITGLFVSSFIGNEVIISGLRGEKRLTEKTEEGLKEEEVEVETVQQEEKTERKIMTEIRDELKEVEKELQELKKDKSQ